MAYSSTREQENQVTIETMQDFYTAMLEYYDEIFPLDEMALSFMLELQRRQRGNNANQPFPLCRYLGIACATGNLENKLASQGMDVTGIDMNSNMVETAKRRMKRGFSSIRFFEMSTIDIGRFLKGGSFNIIGCLENFLPYISDETLLRKFFHDSRALLAPGGNLVIQTLNYDDLNVSRPVRIPDRSSIRVKLSRGYIPTDGKQVILDANLELGNGKTLLLQRNTNILPLTTGQIESYAREAGFTTTTLYGDFSFSPWATESPRTVIVLG